MQRSRMYNVGHENKQTDHKREIISAAVTVFLQLQCYSGQKFLGYFIFLPENHGLYLNVPLPTPETMLIHQTKA